MDKGIRIIDAAVFCCIAFFIGMIAALGFNALQEAKKEGAVTHAEMSEAMQLALRPYDETMRILVAKFREANKPLLTTPTPLVTPNEKSSK